MKSHLASQGRINKILRRNHGEAHVERLALLKELSFGARVAEDETSELASYFVETDQWTRIVRGEVDVVRGEKGAGKSAIYALLVARSDNFFDENILLVSAEKPRGTPVFKDLVSSPPTSETDFVSLWKLYIVTLVAQKIHEFGLNGEHARKLTDILEREGLLEAGFDIARLFRRAVEYTKTWLSPELDFSVSVDPSASIQTFGLKIKPSEVASGDRAKFISVNDLFSLADKALRQADRKIWVLLDRLDVAFAENHELETNALRALFRVYLDLNEYETIRLKIFMRSDIWKRITEKGFREASHITRFAVLEWSNAALLNLIIRRVVSNRVLVKEYSVNRDSVLADFQSQQDLFYRLFPSQVEQGTRKPSTLDWIITRCADGSGKTAPREIIHLLNSVRDEEIARMERGESPAPDGQLFDRSVFKSALPSVSEARLIQTLYAEYPDLKDPIAKLSREKTEQTVETLSVLWEISQPDATILAERLVAVGFFQKRGERNAETYWVPFLYRDALRMIQGMADEAP
jgi:hypothetical protein